MADYSVQTGTGGVGIVLSCELVADPCRGGQAEKYGNLRVWLPLTPG